MKVYEEPFREVSQHPRWLDDGRLVVRTSKMPRYWKSTKLLHMFNSFNLLLDYNFRNSKFEMRHTNSRLSELVSRK